MVGKYAPDAAVGKLGGGGGGGGKKKKKKAAAAGGGAAAGGAAAKKKEAKPSNIFQDWYTGEVGQRKATFLGVLGAGVTGACVVSHFPMGVCALIIGTWWAY